MVLSVCLESQFDSLYYFNGRCDLFDWLHRTIWRFGNKVYCEATFSSDYLVSHKYVLCDFCRFMRDEFNCYVEVVSVVDGINVYCMEE